MAALTSRRVFLTAAPLVTVTALAPTASALAASQIKIEGTVTDKDGKEQVGVVVRVDRPGVNAEKTKTKGEYRIDLAGGDPIGTLSYTHSDFDYATVKYLSGTRSHQISKVLYRPSEARPTLALIETLAAYEHLAAALLLSDSASRQTLLEGFGKSDPSAFLSKLPITSDGAIGKWLAARKQAVEMFLGQAMTTRK